MKIFNSIKWRLQIWYGLILVAVLVGFEFTAYQLEWGRQMRGVDDELHRRFAVLAEASHPHLHPPGRNGEGMPMGGFPDQPPPDGMGGQDPGGQEMGGQGQPGEFHLPPQAAGLFDLDDPNGFYFVITSRDGKEIARGGKVPQGSQGYIADNPDWVSVNRASQLNNASPPPAFTQNGFRQIGNMTPSGERINVGCSIAPQLAALHGIAWDWAGIGGIVLICGLAGGWWISFAALKPIENISAAAMKISAGDLSQRINVAEAESELGQLAATLNATFARLEAAFGQQKQFASDAAHELRTPVTVILTQTQTALRREREAGEYKQTVEACHRAAERMKKLISALLELTRLDAGQERIKRLRFDLSQTVGDCIELIRPLAAEKHVALQPEIAEVEIMGDPSRLAQVVTNLLTNAIQYNHEGGEVRVKLERQSNFAVLTVSDNGIGVPPEDISRIFDRFYRADKSRAGANAGLGLAISKAIIESHGGSIEVTSPESGGTTFTVRLQAG
ncbi:MAG TPA: ATP-binding protein [Verrucomicrobiae bacterium]|jgi:signal transduction histidine kinase